MTTSTRTRRAVTPDSHDFPTRPYDLVKEFTIALGVVIVLTVALAAVFSSPDEKAITVADWANAAPNDVVATAAENSPAPPPARATAPPTTPTAMARPSAHSPCNAGQA